MPRSRGTRAGLRAEHIVDAAHDLLVVEGFEAITMRRIATLLGVAPNALYSHVDDRDAIVIAVLDR